MRTLRHPLRPAVASVVLALALAGCGSSGSSTKSASTPTTAAPAPGAAAGTSDFTVATVHNDLKQTVVFLQCLATCAQTHEQRTIPAGGTNSIPALNSGEQFVYLVKSTSGKRLGCVYMKFDHVKVEPLVQISSLRPCE